MMAAHSILYRRLGWDGTNPLIWASLDTNELIDDDEIQTITIRRGANDPSAHSPSVLTLDTTRNINFSSQSVSVDLSDQAASWLASTCYTTATKIQTRFFGRRGATTARDTHQGLRGTQLTAASWDSVFRRSPDTYNPGAGTSLAAAGIALFNPTWAPAHAGVFGVTDTWFEDPGEVTPGDLLSTLSQRLHLFSPERSGYLRIRTLDTWLDLADAALTTRWPLSRAHVIAPTTWSQPAELPVEYEITIRTPTGHAVIRTAPDGTPTGTVQLDSQDWTTLVARSEHWRRWYGKRASTLQRRWSLPKLSIPLDRLISSPLENHRRAAGMLLELEVGDPVPLAGDWPDILTGVAYCAQINEQIRPDGWSLELTLLPHRWINGLDTDRPPARTWDQARGTWDTQTTTWNQGAAS